MLAKEALTRCEVLENTPSVLLDGFLPVQVLFALCARLADTLRLHQRSARIALCLSIPPLSPLIALLARSGRWLNVGIRIAHSACGV